MNSEIYKEYVEHISKLFGHVNALDFYLQLAGEYIKELQKKRKGGVFDIMMGYEEENDVKNNKNLFGVLKIRSNEMDKFINPVMLNSCNSLLITLITITEIYLQETVNWMFKNKPVIFKSNKEIKLKYTEIIDAGSYDKIMGLILEKELAEISRDNIANSFEALFVKKLNWKVNQDEMSYLKDVSAIRNIIVHNNSKVNSIFLEMVSDPKQYKEGEEIIITPKLLKAYTRKVLDIIKGIDSIVINKCS